MFLSSLAPQQALTVWDAQTGAVLVDGFRPPKSCFALNVAIAPDGSTWAMGCQDNTVGIYELGTANEVGALKQFWRGPPDAASPGFAIAYSPDGRLLVAGSRDGAGTVWLWDVVARKELAPLPHGHEDIDGVAFAPDSRTLVTVGRWRIGEPVTLQEGVRVRLWDVATAKELSCFDVSEGSCEWSLCFAPDGQAIALGERDGTINLWDPITGQEHVTYHTGPGPFDLAFSPDGGFLAAGTRERNRRAWDLAEYVPLRVAKTIYPDPRATTVFDRHSGKALFHLPGCIFPTFSADGRTLYTFSLDSDAIAVWDVPPRRVLPPWVAWLLVGLAVVLAAVTRRGKRLFAAQTWGVSGGQCS
jgi:WD40 repeat protein